MKNLRFRIAATAIIIITSAALSIKAQTGAYRISEPHSYKNLTIFLIHGRDRTVKKNLITLQEALEMKIFKVYETSEVNELMVENISKQFDVFIQSGDIVKGGKQDRILAISVIIPARSGRVSIEAYCVESGRWQKRGNEESGQFTSSNDRVISKELKLAANASRSQTEVWDKVAEAQSKLSKNIGGKVASDVSASSLQLTIENRKVTATADEYVKNLEKLLQGQKDVIGYAFAINGELNSADIYVSNDLFKRLWPRMLKAAAIEAVSETTRNVNAPTPKSSSVQEFISVADKGKANERAASGSSTVVTREKDGNAVFEARDKSKLVVHRNYVKIN